MAVSLGDTAPDFTAETTEGTINFHECLGKHILLTGAAHGLGRQLAIDFARQGAATALTGTSKK